ncbi:Uncharacterised protein [Bordetella pertussis]|nr:Uncharacterised protein [Bordetella pertussis]
MASQASRSSSGRVAATVRPRCGRLAARFTPSAPRAK